MGESGGGQLRLDEKASTMRLIRDDTKKEEKYFGDCLASHRNRSNK